MCLGNTSYYKLFGANSIVTFTEYDLSFLIAEHPQGYNIIPLQTEFVSKLQLFKFDMDCSLRILNKIQG